MRKELTLKYPIKMKHNRVWRIYSGGKLLDQFCGEAEGTDSSYPEDWLASVVEANNIPRQGKPPREGLSICADGGYLKDRIQSEPELMLGKQHVEQFGDNLGVLVKFLDSAVRLPIQVHPDKLTAKKLFHSDYGKTEAWYILGGREINGEKPYILLGFKEDVTPELWRSCFDTQDIAKMEACLHKFYVEPGETYLIRGGTPHAIGAGCFLLEIQEPTDYTISVEKNAPDGSPVPEFLCHQGVGFDRMFDCFHYDTASAEAVKKSCEFFPVLQEKTSSVEKYHLITSEQTDAFILNKICVTDEYPLSSGSQAAVLAIIDGEGILNCGEKSFSLRRGDTVFVPAQTTGSVIMPLKTKSMTLLECLPPSVRK